MKKFKNFVLKTITYVMGLLLAWSISAIDSPSYIPWITLLTKAWLIYFAWANDCLKLDPIDTESEGE